MGKHDNLPPIPSDEELAELAEVAAEHPDPRSTESEVADGEKIEVPLRGFGSPTYGYGGDGDLDVLVNMEDDGDVVASRREERERTEREGMADGGIA
jgi:hypothetical protein